MKTLKTKQILFISVIFLYCLTIYAEQSEQQKHQPQFVISNEQEILNILWGQYPEVSKPLYIAVIRFKDETQLPGSQLNIINKYYRIAGIGPDGRRTYSATNILVRCALKDNPEFEQNLKFSFIAKLYDDRSQTFEELVIFANSEQEARKFTNAFISICDKAASLRFEELKKEITKGKNVIAQVEKSLSEKRTEIKPLQKNLEEKINEYAKANYCSRNEDSIYSLTEKHLEELANLLRNVNFELAVLDAKINSINKYKKSELIIDNETSVKLNQMLISTDIERDGAIAKKQVYEAAFKQANDLHDLIDKKRGVSRSLINLPNTMRSEQSKLQKLEQELENPPAEFRPVEIEDNKVNIRPVKQD